MKRITQHTIAFLMLMACAAGLSASGDISSSVVRIRVTVQENDYYSPWQKENPDTYWQQGCVIADGLILTLSYSMFQYVYVEVSKLGQQVRYPAEVVLQDFNTGLTFLSVDDPGFFSDLTPVTLLEAETPPGDAQVVKWDTTGIFKSYSAKHFRTSIQSYDVVGSALFHEMTTTLDSGGNGEPVFQEGKFLGLTAWFDSERKTIKVNSVATLRWMFQELADGEYRGQPFFWIAANYLWEDKNLKDYLGLAEDDSGLLVHAIPPTSSGYGVLQEGDVILGIDGINIDDNGFCQTGLYGRLNYMWIIALNHYVGDQVELEIVRDKQAQTIRFPLLARTDGSFLIPPKYADPTPRYLVCGGLVFQELSSGYLENWGSDWHKQADKRIVHLYDYQWIYPTPQQRRVVILSRVLPAVMNEGYHDFDNLILESLNGRLPRDLEELRSLLTTTEEPFLRFTFTGKNTIVLRKADVEQEGAAILQKYGIQQAANF